jgi:hypothetical protein
MTKRTRMWTRRLIRGGPRRNKPTLIPASRRLLFWAHLGGIIVDPRIIDLAA